MSPGATNVTFGLPARIFEGFLERAIEPLPQVRCRGGVDLVGAHGTGDLHFEEAQRLGH